MGKSNNTTEPRRKGSGGGGEKDGKMHRRSRSGCYTCRLRRKKCDEGKDSCRACRHLGLQCEYKRPGWWGDADRRRAYKEEIKDIIKETKTIEKTNQQAQAQAAAANAAAGMVAGAAANGHIAATTTPNQGSTTPPDLSYSLPTSATYTVTPGGRTSSEEDGVGQFASPFDFSQPPGSGEHFAHHQVHHHPHVFSPTTASFDTHAHPHYNHTHPYYQPYAPTAAPFEVDVKTESQTYINDVPARKDSSTSTYSTWQPPPEMTPFLDNEWVQDGLFSPPAPMAAPSTDMFGSGADVGNGYDFLDPAIAVATPTQPNTGLMSPPLDLELEPCDKPLLDHFLQTVVPLLFPVLECNRPGFARAEIIQPALQSNETYLRCCLHIAAEHLKSTLCYQGPEAEEELLRIRGAAVYALHAEIERESIGQHLDHRALLDATLPMTIYKAAVGRSDDVAIEVPWHGHFQVISDVVKRLNLEYAVDHYCGQEPATPVAMTQTAWVDILGATMKVRSPLFAPSYRTKFESGTSSGLREMMGCDDKVMYLISEIACLDAIKQEAVEDEWKICEMIAMLGRYLDTTMPSPPPPLKSPLLMPTGIIDAEQLNTNITALFCIAARIYLVGLVPNHTDTTDSNDKLVEDMANVLDHIPAGPQNGFDRAVVWPLLIGGSASGPGSRLRGAMEDRAAALGEVGEYGSFGKMMALVREVWRLSAEEEAAAAPLTPQEQDHPPQSQQHTVEQQGGRRRNVHWRNVMMQHEGWQDFLII